MSGLVHMAIKVLDGENIENNITKWFNCNAIDWNMSILLMKTALIE